TSSLLCWREASANRSNFSALRGVIMARGQAFLGQEESGWVLRGSLADSEVLRGFLLTQWQYSAGLPFTASFF
ncbi:hypothetical protein, partial [Paracidovorax cattleyae]|uniref:hypothetical protein n=1 Tax=Paracidovorax cattleyae TaxID=80868 RepID=UPI001ABF0710